MDNQSLSHVRWKCQYHIVFISKYRKRVLCINNWKYNRRGNKEIHPRAVRRVEERRKQKYLFIEDQ